MGKVEFGRKGGVIEGGVVEMVESMEVTSLLVLNAQPTNRVISRRFDGRGLSYRTEL